MRRLRRIVVPAVFLGVVLATGAAPAIASDLVWDTGSMRDTQAGALSVQTVKLVPTSANDLVWD
ncbi:hypothetical protein [Streptomyces sp. NPDC001380]|uniref:hypothetical protein n=1 Tax=Streptomyces sp. NPDC001380 TaxID=3364566 RepID=UPI003684D15F